MAEEDQDKESQILAEQQDGRSQRTERPHVSPGGRTGWQKGLSAEERTQTGARLLAWLFREANERGIQMQELAEHLGVTYGYLAQLRKGPERGGREIKKVSEDFIDNAARFLGVPRLSVLIAAGVVRLEDFRQVESWEHELDRALSYLESDPVYGR